MKKTLILLTGKPGSGKDTVADIMKRVSPELFQPLPIKLADPLIRMLSVMFPGFSYEYNVKMNRDRSLKELPSDVFMGASYRECAIWLAEECIKPKFGKDFFIKHLLNMVDRNGNSCFTITDLGFKNDELSHIDHNKYNVFVVKIVRDNLDNIKDSREDIQEDIFYTINNNGTLDDLENECSKIIDLIQKEIKERSQ